MPLEYFIPNIRSTSNPSQLDDAIEALRIANEDNLELIKAIAKCDSLGEVDGKLVSIIGLKLCDKTSTEYIEMEYICDGKRHVRTYKRQEFYDL